MPAADFAAAQARLAARRQEHQRQAALSRKQRESSLPTANIPFPFRTIGDTSLSLWDTIRGREGSRPAFRVGQVDAELLDEELLELMKSQVGEGLKHYGTQLHNDWSAEIQLILRAILFKLSIWDHNASYGASLQGLRYSDARDSGLSRPVPQRWQKALYGIITVFGRYGWTKWEDYLLNQEAGYEPPTSTIRKLSRFTSNLSTMHNVVSMASFLTFLVNGQYRTILDRILRLRLVPTSSHTRREVSFEYLNRQLVWHAFTEFLLFLLPLVGITRWRRILSRTWKKILASTKRFFGQKVDEENINTEKGGELGFLPERTCAICYSDQNPSAGNIGENEIVAASIGGGGVIGSAATDITNPYESIPCGCVYCFVCIAQRIEGEEGDGWTCLRCGQLILECKPWNGDVLEEIPRSVAHGKSVGFMSDTFHGSELPLTPGLSDVTLKELEPMPAEDDLDTVEEDEHETPSYEEPEPMLGAESNDSAAWAATVEYSEDSSTYDSEEVDEEEEEVEDDDDDDDVYSHKGISFEH